MSKLFDLAVNPEQYTHGEAASWLADEARPKAQRETFWNAIKPLIPLNCKSVLDIGCGSGWTAERLFAMGVEKYVGLEPSLKNFEIAKHEHPEAKVERLSLAEYNTEETFDCVLALMMMSHIPNVV